MIFSRACSVVLFRIAVLFRISVLSGLKQQLRLKKQLIALSAAACILQPHELFAEDGRSNSKSAVPQEIVIESVLASVDGVPITLRDFSEKLSPKRKVNLSDFASDPALVQTLDAMILERLIEAESASRKIKASAEDIERYTDQVASQNNMTRQQFEQALAGQGKTLDEFKAQARLEILRGRLMGQIAQSAPAVTDEELGVSDGEHEDLSSDQAEENQSVRFRIREIVFLKKEGSDNQAEEKAATIMDRLAAGESFHDLARQFSDGSTASNGGDLGELAEDDLSDVIRDAVSELSPGQHSELVNMEDGDRIFFLEQRFEEGEASDSARQDREQLRKQLESRKLEDKFREFFTVELPKLHKVDRKV